MRIVTGSINSARFSSAFFTRLKAITLLLSAVVTNVSLAGSQFSGGACQSQGSWLQEALNQADIVSSAINNLRNDPRCQALIRAVESSPKFTSTSRSLEYPSFANTYRELQSIGQYMRPSRMSAGMDRQAFRDVVLNVVFNKSYEAIRDIHNDADMASYSKEQREDIRNVSLGLKSFLKRSSDIANITIATTRNLVAALPESRLCMDNRPSEAAAIFGAVAQATTALVSGGQINGVGELVASLMQYSRDMKFVRALTPIELVRYQNSVSCLLESTADAYCSINEAEVSLDFVNASAADSAGVSKKELQDVIRNESRDPMLNPLGGLIILMRDVPIIQMWMQRVLLGVDPRLSIEAKMKNDYWQSYLGFVQKANSAIGNFRDREQLYFDTSEGKNYDAKLGQVREIFDALMSTVGPTNYEQGDDNLNFFTRAMQPQIMRFYILGYDSVPPEFLEKVMVGFNVQFDNWWLQNASKRTGIFSNPDELLRTMRSRLAQLVDRAQIEANGFFAKRMVVDPQNLLAEAMRGPGLTPFEGFHNLRTYYLNLIVKLEKGAAIVGDDSDAMAQVRKDQLLAQIPLLRNSVARIDRIIAALRSIASISANDRGRAKLQSEEVMGIVYEAAYMLVARDSFFGKRMQTALHADLSDTLRRKSQLTEKQAMIFMSIAPELVNRLSSLFTNDPILKRGDVSSAKLVHLANLKSTEILFAKVLFNQILQLDCELYGGEFCTLAKRGSYDPSDKNYTGVGSAAMANQLLKGLLNENGEPTFTTEESGGFSIFDWFKRPSRPIEDSRSHHFMRAKLCVQALAFESRERFKSICAGAKLVSDFSDTQDSMGLNMSFDQQLRRIQDIKAGKNEGRRIDAARTEGVCSFNQYLRKNRVYFMYREYKRAD